jgi:hypothetical protein
MVSKVFRVGVEGTDDIGTFLETMEVIRSQLIQLDPERNWKFRRMEQKKADEGLVDYLVFDNEE